MASGLPAFQNTVLGWVISGKVGNAHLSSATCGICTDDEENLESDIARLWELDEVKPSGKVLSISDKQCEAHFGINYKMSENGRFIVKLPLCKTPQDLGESDGIAFNRFLPLTSRASTYDLWKNMKRWAT